MTKQPKKNIKPRDATLDVYFDWFIAVHRVPAR